MSGLASSSPLSPEDIEILQGRFSKLEADVDAFSMTLNRLANAHRLSSSTGNSVNPAASRHQHPRRLVFASQPASALAMVMVVLVGAAMTLALRKMRMQKVGRSALLVTLWITVSTCTTDSCHANSAIFIDTNAYV